ncbi:ER degradation-enhancing alpha-mannosidase-like protein 2 isoform X2 [Rhinoraja longicauda]
MDKEQNGAGTHRPASRIEGKAIRLSPLRIDADRGRRRWVSGFLLTRNARSSGAAPRSPRPPGGRGSEPMLSSLYTACFVLVAWTGGNVAKGKEIGVEAMAQYRERVKGMFYHAYNNYLDNAFPYDELRPLTCDGQDTWGSFSLTLIDALDTLLVLGNVTEFQRVVHILQDGMNFDIDVNASVFETNIRVVGGLLSAHLLSREGGIVLEPGWPCAGPLLRLAEEAARKLLPAFQTPTGMPFGTVNLMNGVNPSETPVTCTAGIGTFILEFATLSRLTGDPVFEQVARKALDGLWNSRSDIGLVGNHIDVLTSKWVAQDAGIGAGVDSYFEYLVKGAILLQDEGLMSSFLELIESAMYLYRATGDPTLLELGRDVVEAIEKISRVDCGFATVRDLRDHKLDNRMESFFLAETVKYLYLLFDPDNFLHNDGTSFHTVTTPYGECVLGAGGYLFNTEAHPIDPAALHCCSQHRQERWEVEALMQEFHSARYERTGFHHASSPVQRSHHGTSKRKAQNGDRAKKIRNKKGDCVLGCPSQHFSSKLAVLGQVFTDSS